jgi:hypothetical protein
MTNYMSNEEVAREIRERKIGWDLDLMEELCARAGLRQEFRQADAETFEEVAYKAAEILNVEIV